MAYKSNSKNCISIVHTKLCRLFRLRITYIFLIILTIIILIPTANWLNDEYTKYIKRCYQYQHIYQMNQVDKSIVLLEDIVKSQRKPKLGKTIFFHETSCINNGLIKLNARQACSIESAALTNPTWDIFVLFASPVGFDDEKSSTLPIINALKSYKNIYWRNVNLWTYSRDTPANEWINTDELFKSKYLYAHTADYLRYLSLYKFGGTHLDLDFIMKKSIEQLTPNYAGAETNVDVANGLMNFDYQGVGHDIVEYLLREFVNNFKGSDWSHNGPALLSRGLREICNTTTVDGMTRDKCNQYFHVYPVNEFFAIDYRNWMDLFDPKKAAESLNRTRNSIAVHFWNKMSAHKKLTINRPEWGDQMDDESAYIIYAKEFCPKVFNSCGQYF